MKLWSAPVEEFFKQLKSQSEGLSQREALNRLKTYGLNRLKPKKNTAWIYLLFSQFKSPLILILLFAAVEKMLSLVQVKTNVLRDGKEIEIPTDHVVPGDIVILNAGDLIPADCRLVESKDFFVDEATLTGESFAVEKQEGILPEETPLAKRTNCVFMGTHVISGTAKAPVRRLCKA